MVKRKIGLHWWQVLVMSLAGFGGPGAVLALFPKFSSGMAAVALGFTLLGVTLTLIGVRLRNWWTQVGIANAWLLLFLGIAFRAFIELGPLGFGCGVLALILYGVAWVLPALTLGLSGFLLREQFSPQTRIGRGCLAISLALLPTAAGLAATFGYFGSRFGISKSLLLAVAALGSLSSIAGAQAISHQMWHRRPWATIASTPKAGGSSGPN